MSNRCFTQPSQKISSLHEYLLVGNVGTSIVICMRLKLDYVLDLVINSKDYFKSFSLLSRAWLHQERPLSPRVLYFAGHGLSWECKQGSICKCSFIVTASTHHKVDHAKYCTPDPDIDADMIFTTSSQIISAEDLISFSSSESRWSRFLSNHFSLNMTHKNDMLPSLSGRVKEWIFYKNDEYLTGLWKNTLVSDLIWFTTASFSRSWGYRSPSW